VIPSEAWDDEYRLKRNLWTGRPPPLPDLPAGTRVLELGCGNGKTLVALARRGWDVTGVEISPSALELAGEELKRSGLGAKLEVANAGDLHFADGSFGAVFAYHVLDHLPAPERGRAVSEALRVLTPGGALYVRTFSANDMRYGTGREVEPDTFERGTGIATHYFRPEEVESLLGGFSRSKVWTESREVRIGGEKKLREWVVAVGVK